MDMSDVRHRPAADAATDPDATDEARWRDLVAQLSVEIAAPLTAALERVHALASTGRIDRASLRALREEIVQARARPA